MEFSAEQIARLLGAEVVGDSQRKVTNVAPIEAAKERDLCFLGEEKYLAYLPATRASVVLVTKSLRAEWHENEQVATLILVDNARGAMAQLLTAVEERLHPKRTETTIDPSAYVAPSAHIGNGVQIYPHCYVGDNVQIGDHTILYPNVTVYHDCRIGKDCVLHAGAVIGADGFGFIQQAGQQDDLYKVPQVGTVVIEDDVEIGANSCVDRAMMGETRIGRNTKIDNLVQIGHNVTVGESTILCAQVGIAGSTQIGSHVTLAGQVGVAGHIEVCDHVVVGAQSGVAGSIREPGIYMGSPAIDAHIWRRASVRFKQSGQVRPKG